MQHRSRILSTREEDEVAEEDFGKGELRSSMNLVRISCFFSIGGIVSRFSTWITFYSSRAVYTEHSFSLPLSRGSSSIYICPGSFLFCSIQRLLVASSNNSSNSSSRSGGALFFALSSSFLATTSGEIASSLHIFRCRTTFVVILILYSS